jgi:hypothetical protein
MYSDLKNLGYNPYAPEFSQLIREGKANRLHWRVLGPIVNFMIRRKIFLGRQVRTSLDWLQMNESELAICPSGGSCGDAGACGTADFAKEPSFLPAGELEVAGYVHS